MCIHMNNLHSLKYNNQYKCEVVEKQKYYRDENTVEFYTCLLLISKHLT